ncbi:MAG: glycosyltransferase [Bauldia sp.]|nr:glycosyltransferase [Bauldia sp.]MCW5716336.1 glycosyltransferase [Bauldia sp.]
MLLYVSNGNIPSQWAHTVQTMKMSEAYAKRLGRPRRRGGFQLLIASDYRRYLLGRPSLRKWYGLRGRVNARRIPMAWALERAAFDRVTWPEWEERAVAHAAASKPELVVTRSYTIAQKCLEGGLEVLFETHAGPGNPKLGTLAGIAAHSGCRGFVTTTEPLRQLYVEHGVPADRILVWPNAVDLDRFVVRPRARSRIRSSLPFGRNATLVAYSGGLYEKKGIRTVLDAARLAPEADFLLIGGWPQDVTRWQAEYPDLANVHFQGFVNNVELGAWLAAADILVLPASASDPDAAHTSPLKLFEYMASGRPIVASAVPALAAVLTDETDALLVPPDDAPALAAAVRRVHDDPALAARLSAASRARASDFTWDKRVEAILRRFAPEFLA